MVGDGPCQYNEFQCANRQCILKSFQCDGQPDCQDSSDEVGCSKYFIIDRTNKRTALTFSLSNSGSRGYSTSSSNDYSGVGIYIQYFLSCNWCSHPIGCVAFELGTHPRKMCDIKLKWIRSTHLP